MDRVRLNVLGISGSQDKSGAYVLMLGEQGGSRRIPVVIGVSEAQSIALCLERQTPPRPLTHDLFFKLCGDFNVEMLEAFIHEFREGVFYSSILCFNGEKEVILDARTSDAVALALRFRCPIFVTEEIIKVTGIGFVSPDAESELDKLKNMSLEELYIMLSDMVKNEDYEMASAIRDEIKSRDNI